MRGDFVEEQDRRRPAPVGDQVCVGEDETQQQRLLLARGGLRGGHGLGVVDDVEILPVGTNEGSPRSFISRAA